MAGRYDRALTIFSPDGHLFQVEYAMEAVRKGATVVGVRGSDSVVLAVEKRAAAKLQDTRTMRKIARLDSHIMSYRLTMEDAPSVEFISRWVATMQQRYTQRGGVRPFGVAALVAGFNPDGTPALFKTEPSGNYTAWKAATTGKNDKSVREFLEKAWEAEMDKDATVRLAIKALLEVVDSGSKNVEVVVLTKDSSETLSEEALEALCKAIEEEKEEKKKTEAAKK